MTKQEVYDFLKARKIWHEITEHPPVYDMAGLAQIPIPYPEADAKNLFVRDDKKRDYYLITVKGDKRVDLKEFRRNNQTRALSFATAQELMSILGLPLDRSRLWAFCTTPRERCTSIWTPVFWSPRA